LGPAGAAIGYSGAEIDPERIDIWFGDLPICRDGGRASNSTRRGACLFEAAGVFYSHPTESRRRYVQFLTTDLTNEYVHINADYST
jgi:glutamate N-acetyltransferase / amino-acid N-acetyltransferase